MPLTRLDKRLSLTNFSISNDNDRLWNLQLTAKSWLDRQYHDQSKTRIKKLHEMEDEMQKPSNTIDEKIFNRIAGSMLGLALGSGSGTHYQRQLGYEISGYEIQMALCLANSLIVSEVFNLYDQLVRYKWWYRHGYMSSTETCFDTEHLTKILIEDFEKYQQLLAEQYQIPLSDMDSLSDPKLLQKFDVYWSQNQTNNNCDALVCLAPIPLFFFRYPPAAVEYAGQSSRAMRSDIRAIDACRYFSALIVAALQNYSKDELLDDHFYIKHRSWFRQKDLHQEIIHIAEGSYKSTTRINHLEKIQDELSISEALETVLWIFWSTNSFEEGVSVALDVNHGRRTIATIYGQLAGAFYGRMNLSDYRLDHLYGKKFISILSEWIVYEGERWLTICLSNRTNDPTDQPKHSSVVLSSSKKIDELAESSSNTSDYTHLVRLMEGNVQDAADQIMHWIRRLPNYIDIDGVDYIYHPDRYETFLKRIEIVETMQKPRRTWISFELNKVNAYEQKRMMERLAKFQRQIRHNLSDSITLVRGWYGCSLAEMFHITNDGFSHMVQVGPSDTDRGFCFKSSTKAAAEDAGSDGCVLMCYIILRNPFPTIIGQTSSTQTNNRYRYYSDGEHPVFQESTQKDISVPYHEIYYGFYDEFVTDQPDDVLPQVIVYLQRRS